MLLEDLIAEVASRGLRVNNLFQLPDGRWQSNLTDGELYWDFGRGPDASAALVAALAKHRTSQPSLGIKPPPPERKPTRAALSHAPLPQGSI